MKKIAFFLIFMGCSTVIFAQNNIGLTLTTVPTPPQYVRQKLPFLTTSKPIFQQPTAAKPAAIPIVLKAETLPFFCKIEHKFNSQQALPVKFRLGSVDYVDELEGKGKVKNQ